MDPTTTQTGFLLRYAYHILSYPILQGARLALLRMASEMQACLPSSRFPLTRYQASNLVKGSEDDVDDSTSTSTSDVPLATRDSGLDVVQRHFLRVAAAAFLLKRHLFRYQGTVSAALVLGGVDAVGEHLYQASVANLQPAQLAVKHGGWRERSAS